MTLKELREHRLRLWASVTAPAKQVAQKWRDAKKAYQNWREPPEPPPSTLILSRMLVAPITQQPYCSIRLVRREDIRVVEIWPHESSFARCGYLFDASLSAQMAEALLEFDRYMHPPPPDNLPSIELSTNKQIPNNGS